MQFILTFGAIYFISTIIGQNMRIFTREPELIRIQSPTIYALLIFPYGFITKQRMIRMQERSLMRSELLFCIINLITLIGTVILQIMPSMPCEVLELTFGRRHRWLDITLDTYNKKIPLAAVLAICCIELLVLFGEILIRAVRDAEFGKKLGKGMFILTVALCLLFIAVLILSICLLF